jgi:hypothetical protein
MTLRLSSGQAYVEWLRVRGCLKWTAIVLAVGVALLLFGRFTYLDIGGHNDLSSEQWSVAPHQTFAQFKAASHVAETKLPDGTLHTVIDNPKEHVRVTIDDRGYWGGRHIEMYGWGPHFAHASDVELQYFNFGDIHLNIKRVPNGLVASADLGAAVPEDLAYYFMLAAITALIVATVLGAPFARENDGHLEIALTKPIARVPFALGNIGADLCAIVAAWAMTVAFMIVGHTIFEAPKYVFGSSDLTAIGLGLFSAIAWYFMLSAATASMKRAYGTVLGIAWPVALLVHWLATAQLGNAPLSRAIHAVAATLAWIDPLTYVRFIPVNTTATLGGNVSTASAVAAYSLPILIVLAIVYAALAIVQWQRVEA